MSEQCYLAIDLGAESGRVIAGLFDGSRLRLEEIHRFPNGAVSGGRLPPVERPRPVERDRHRPHQGRPDLRPTGRFGRRRHLGGRLRAARPTGEILGQPHHYRDQRTKGVMDEAFLRVPRSEIFETTGLQFMTINTLYQLIAMAPRFPRDAGVRRPFPDDGRLLPLAPLRGAVVEFTNASTSQCLSATTRDWAYDMLGKFDLPARIFPEVVAPGTKLGKLRPELSERCRLPRIDVVTPATHDTAAAVVAVPTELTGTARWAYISSGTWSLMGLELPEAVLTAARAPTQRHQRGGRRRTYRLLKNIMGLWLVQECRRVWEREGRALTYGELTLLATEAEPLRSLVDPDDPAFLNPPTCPPPSATGADARGNRCRKVPGRWCGCALESLALKYRVVLEWLEELSGETVEVIHVVGGGSQNALLNQFAANACGRRLVAGPVEATAMGNVLVQARTAGAVSSLAEMRKVVHASSDLRTFEPEERGVWQSAYERFRALLATK